MLIKTLALCSALLLAEDAAPATAPLPDEFYQPLPSEEALRANERRLWLARRLYRARDFDTAIKLCENILAIDANNNSALILLEECRLQIRNAERKVSEKREHYREELAIDEVAEESGIPQMPPAQPRPSLPLRGRAAKSPELERMEALLAQKVRLNFIDVDLDYLLNALFKTTGVNIIADQNLLAGKRLTLHVEDIPLKEVLEFITKIHTDLDYVVKPSAVWIVAKDKPVLEHRIYPLNTGLVAFEQTSTGGGFRRTAGIGTGISQPAGGQRAAAQVAGEPTGPSRSYLEEVMDWVTGWTDEWPAGSQYYVDRKTNSLIVLTTPTMHQKVETILDIIDNPPIQVLIRTKFIEISTTDQFDLGFDVSLTRTALPTDPTAKPPLPDLGPPRRMEWAAGTGTDLGVAQGGGLNLIFHGNTTNPQFRAIMRMFEQNTRAKLLSAPQVLALNNQKATINLSTQFEVPTYQAASSTVTSPSGTTITPTAFVPTGFETMEVGFYFEVTPSVGRDLKHIILELHPLVDDVEGGTDRFQQFEIITAPQQGQTTTQKIVRPVIKRREVATRLVVQDGEVVILGGLMRSRKERIVKRVPILGYLPIIGLLFRSQSDTTERSNLYIVVQANIVTPAGATYEKPEAVFPAAIAATVRPEGAGRWFFEYTPETEEALARQRYPASQR